MSIHQKCVLIPLIQSKILSHFIFRIAKQTSLISIQTLIIDNLKEGRVQLTQYITQSQLCSVMYSERLTKLQVFAESKLGQVFRECSVAVVVK